jgi:predicted nuclease with TOPRIM domain
VEVTQAQLLSDRDELRQELELTQDDYARLERENAEMHEELRRMKVYIEMEKTMKVHTSGPLHPLESFTSFEEPFEDQPVKHTHTSHHHSANNTTENNTLSTTGAEAAEEEEFY